MKRMGIAGALSLALLNAAHANEVVIPGSFAVSESGAATYSIDIDVPPGTAGMEPKLSLTYSSQGGNSLLGMGWSLSGLSSITRCPKTLSQDGVRGAVKFDSNDRFCLDGQRLIATSGAYGASGTEYRTEMEGFSRITSTGTTGTGPTSFTVETKAGLTMTYGATTDSRLHPSGNTSVMTWAVNRIEDTVGNYMTMSYFVDAAESASYPSTISYTGNGATAPSALVQFSYEGRTDKPKFYHEGSPIRTVDRIKTIVTHANGTPITNYNLAYSNSPYTGRTRLSSVEKCAGTGGCLPKTSFAYHTGLSDRFSVSNNVAGQDGTFVSYQSSLADFNADGRADVLWDRIANDGLSMGLRGAWTSQGTGFHVDTNVALSNGTLNQYTPYTFDADGNGGADIFWFDPDIYGRYQNQPFHVLRQQTRGVWTQSSVAGTYAYLWEYTPYFGDFDGDGRSDILWDHANIHGLSRGTRQLWLTTGVTSTTYNYSHLTNVAGQDGTLTWAKPHVSDFNGDGMSDILWNVEDAYGRSSGASPLRSLWLSTGGGNFQVINNVAGQDGQLKLYLPVIGDFNGDGKTDLLWSHSDTYGRSLGDRVLWLSKGDGSFEIINNPGGLNGQSAHHVPYAADLNGDGFTDVLWDWADNFGRSTGDRDIWLAADSGTFVEHSLVGAVADGTIVGYRPRLGDIDGNGSTDIVWDHGDTSGRSIGTRVAWITRLDTQFDRLSSVDDGFGQKIQLTYKPLTDSSVYAKGSGSTYPEVDLQVPSYVVSRAEVRDGIGGFVPTEYRYGGLKARADGRGSLGFAWTEAKQVETGFVTRREYRQDFPYVGRVWRERTNAPGVGLAGALSQKNYSFGCLNPANGLGCTVAAGNRYFPYASAIVEKGWDLDGSVLPVVTTTNAYDGWGNPTQINVFTSDGFTKATTNTYTNDVSAWILGRLTRTEVTDVSP